MKVLNRETADWEHDNKTASNACIESLADELSYDEFNISLENLAWHENPGINGLSSNILKLLESKNKLILLISIKEWMGKPEFAFKE